MTVRAAVVPLRSGTDEVANTAAVTAAVRDAGDQGADLVVLPEYAGLFDPRGVRPEHAEPVDGPFVTAVREAAAQARVTVVVGTVVPGTRADRAVNTVLVVRPSGEVAGAYRKVHLYDAFGHRESDRFESGPADAAPVVVDVAGIRLGVLTCYDLRFPESARRLVDGGATALAVPAAWAAGEHKADQWRTLLRARAIESCAYALGATQQGRGVTGASMVVDPSGVVLAESGQEVRRPAAAELDPQVVAAVRERNPSLQNRRYDVVPRG